MTQQQEFNPSDYAQNPVSDQAGGAGDYRAFPVSWTVEVSMTDEQKVQAQAKEEEVSHSIAIVIRYAITHQWDVSTKAWTQWPMGYYVDGRTYVVKKNGTQNDIGIDQLRDSGIWTPGDFAAIKSAPPQALCLISVERNDWKGSISYRVNWTSPNADQPRARGGFTPASDSVLDQLRTQFGGSMGARAVAPGQPVRVAPPPTGEMPPATQPAQQVAPQVGHPQHQIPQQVAPPHQPTPQPMPGQPVQQLPPATGGPQDPIDPGATPF